MYYRDAAAAVVVFDVTNLASVLLIYIIFSFFNIFDKLCHVSIAQLCSAWHCCCCCCYCEVFAVKYT